MVLNGGMGSLSRNGIHLYSWNPLLEEKRKCTTHRFAQSVHNPQVYNHAYRLTLRWPKAHLLWATWKSLKREKCWWASQIAVCMAMLPPTDTEQKWKRGKHDTLLPVQIIFWGCFIEGQADRYWRASSCICTHHLMIKMKMIRLKNYLHAISQQTPKARTTCSAFPKYFAREAAYTFKLKVTAWQCTY